MSKELSYEALAAIPAKGDPTCLPFDNAWDFYMAFFNDEQLYRWQIEELLQLSGYADPYDPKSRVEPTKDAVMRKTLLAANGSGKDMIVLSIWALWEICCHCQSHWIATSASFKQLDEQTWRHIKSRAERLQSILGEQELTIKKHKVIYRKSKSEITLFRTDEKGKTEGWHPIVTGGRMIIVLNEAKEFEDELITAFRKCHGYTHWVNVSSAGDPFGYFYEKCLKPDDQWPNPLKLGRNYFRKITVNDCPHLKSEFEFDLTEFDIDDPYIQNSYLSNFVTSGAFFVIPPDRLIYAFPPRDELGMPRRAGIDFGLGGDSTVISIWQGNHFIKEIEFNEAHEPTLTRMVCAAIRQENLECDQVCGDLGNFGQAIIPRIREDGLPILGLHNQSKPLNAKAYVNRGIETAMNFSRLVTDKLLNLDKLPSKLKRQMIQRQYFYKNGKRQLEDKAEFRARIGYSPNNLDAAILAHVNVSAHTLKAISALILTQTADPNQHWKKEYEEIYGKLDNDRANAGVYRTSGTYGRREIGSPLRSINRRLAGSRG